MHKQGEPGDMQTNPSYRHVDREVRDFFYDSIQRCRSYGISAQRLVLDPGFGFGKPMPIIWTYSKPYRSLQTLAAPAGRHLAQIHDRAPARA